MAENFIILFVNQLICKRLHHTEREAARIYIVDAATTARAPRDEGLDAAAEHSGTGSVNRIGKNTYVVLSNLEL